MSSQPCNEKISDIEIFGRITNYTSQVKNDGSLRSSCMYPRKNQDKDNPGYFTNKISVVRLCRGHNDIFTWDRHVKIAESFLHGKNKFKGFIIARVSLIRDCGFDVECAASKENPYHAHILIPDYHEPFRDVETISEVLSQKIRLRIDRLRESMRRVEFDSTSMISTDYADLCAVCHVL